MNMGEFDLIPVIFPLALVPRLEEGEVVVFPERQRLAVSSDCGQVNVF